MRLLTWIFVGLVCLSGCVPEKVENNTSQGTTIDTTQRSTEHAESETITVFLSGNTLSQLKPCGCAAGQLGGFSGRQAIFDKVDAKNRLLVDTGNFLIDNTPQDMVKLDTIITSLITLNYDVVNFNKDDLLLAGGRFPIKQMPFKIIGDSKELDSVFRRNISGSAITVASVSAQAIESGSIDQDDLETLFSKGTVSAADLTAVRILIVDHFNEKIADFLANSPIDIAVCPYESDDPSIIKTKHEKPLFVSVGKLGKYIGRLDLTLSDTKGLQLSYSEIPVEKKLRPLPELDEIYQAYRDMVKNEDLLGQVVRTDLPNGLKYVGSDKCMDCHEYAYEKWAKMPHAHAYQTLVDSGDAYDPECIKCHVVGLEYASGFENKNSPKGLRNVGCEVCHGPRSKHIKEQLDDTENVDKSKPFAALTCISCHSSEHSPGFQADEAGYRKKNAHWKEQKSK